MPSAPGYLGLFWPFGPKRAFGLLPPTVAKQAPLGPSGLEAPSGHKSYDWEGFRTPASHPIFGGFWGFWEKWSFFHRGSGIIFPSDFRPFWELGGAVHTFLAKKGWHFLVILSKKCAPLHPVVISGGFSEWLP